MNPLELVKLTALMERTSGRSEVKIGLIDGPVNTQLDALRDANISSAPLADHSVDVQRRSTDCLHGTFIAAILAARRGSPAPAICPNCTLLLCPVFTETSLGPKDMPGTTPAILAAAIRETIAAGAGILNLSLALAQPSNRGEQELTEALDLAIKHGVLVVAAAGNQGTLGSSVITRHPWVIPVSACDGYGQPLRQSNLSGSIGKQGLSAPGDNITSLNTEGYALTLGGTSVAVPFVTGAIALLWSVFPEATALQIKQALLQRNPARRASIVPPLLNAAAAYQALANAKGQGGKT